MKFKTVLMAAAAALAIGSASAQTVLTNIPALFGSNNLSSTLTLAVQALVQLPVGSSITLNGQAFTFTTNASGQVTGVTSTGPAGNQTVTAFTTPQQVENAVLANLNANNPLLSTYYGSNDLTASVGVDYVQNSGQTLAEIGIGYYGLIPGAPNLGVRASVLQGSKGGQQSTAGGTAGLDYRKVIGSAAAHVGVGVIYDAWAKAPGGYADAGVELRQSAHLGAFAGARYVYEQNAAGNNNLSGLWLVSEITYSF